MGDDECGGSVKTMERVSVLQKSWKLCDNEAAVMLFMAGKTRDEFLGACYRNLWLICAENNIDLEVMYIKGKDNVIADTLSRLNQGQVHNSTVENLCEGCTWWQVPLAYLDLNMVI